MQRTFWKQRRKIRWIKEGDVGTKFFHAHATIKNRRNTISTLSTGNGFILSGHDQKAELIWQSFREIFGTSEDSVMLFDQEELLTRPLDLSCLKTDFTKDEIIAVISDLPTDKSPGPDGFNSDFSKKY
jgi:hypothetical protein